VPVFRYIDERYVGKRNLLKLRVIIIQMETESINVDKKDFMKVMRDVELIKNILLDEGELTEWAKKELDDTRKIPLSECVSHEEVKEMIFEK
jgi:hypothetical protein